MIDPEIIDVFLAGRRVGRMTLTRDGLCAFEYAAEFLADGFSISPFVLPLEKKVFVADRDPFCGNFGVFDDSLPDGWGRLLQMRFLRERGVDASRLSPLRRLALVGPRGRGALEYVPDAGESAESEFRDFAKIARDCEKILEEKEVAAEDLEALYRGGGSSGGARPKIFAKLDGREWLVKFRASADPQDVGALEYACSRLARECGVEMPETRLLCGKFFAAARFDRDADGGKTHTVSASGLAHAYYRIPSLDYADLMLITRTLTRDERQVAQMFRRMVFNVLIGNRDDHSKNFAFQCRAGTWTLAPAYDLLPSEGFNGLHTTAVNGKGVPSLEDVAELARRFGVPAWRGVVEEIAERVRAAGLLLQEI